ncbi:MAG: hypothetical protein KKD83_00095 [Chloroflexi bacterium]|nr:hypothetical protein [Chloroflexota bacterium]
MPISLPFDRPITREELREVLLQVIKKQADNIQPHMLRDPDSVAQAFGLSQADIAKFAKQNEEAGGSQNFQRRSAEIFNEFLLNGIIMPKWGQSWGIFELTELGAQVIRGEEAMLLDPEGLAQRYNDLIPGGPDLSADYYKEAIFAYHQRLFRCSTIALGVASEDVLLKTARSIYEYAVNPQRKGDHKNRTLLDWRLAKVVEQMRQVLRSHDFRTNLEEDLRNNPLPFNQMDRKTMEEAWNSAGILADLYRQTRNEQGHPLGIAVDPNLLKAQIMAFPRYAEVLFNISWIVSGKSPQFRALRIVGLRKL